MPRLFSIFCLLVLLGGVTEGAGEKEGGQAESLGLHSRLVDEFRNVDPEAAGWESESFSADVGEQMKGVAKLLVGDVVLESAMVEDLLAENYEGSELAPRDLQALNRNGALAVMGAAKERGTHPGAEGFTAALEELRSILDGAQDRRAKFKVMHVELNGDHAVTGMLFEFRGRKEDGWTQVTSTWHCEWTIEAPHRLQKVKVTDYRVARPGGQGRLEFVDAAPAVLAPAESYRTQLALSFDYWRARSDKSLVADLLGAQGVAVGDVNGDELDDVYVLQPGGLPNRLFLHQPDGTARDISAEAGVDVLDFCRSALLVDLDNDGDQDLVLALAWKIQLFENDGGGRFTKRGLYPSEGQINSMSAADYDNDGDLDLYLCGRDASGAIKAEQGALGIPMPYYDANNGGPNTLYENVGSFALENRTRETGLDAHNRRFSLACAWEDFDGDGDQDLYVSNDFGRNNLFRNDPGERPGTRHFVDVAEQAGVVDIGPGMSAAWGDHNQDGHPDLYIGNMWSSAGHRITLQKQFLPGSNAEIRQQARRHARGNSTYLSRGDGTFTDITASSGANMARWAWSSNFIDLDNDGNRDLVVANGMITTADTGDL